MIEPGIEKVILKKVRHMSHQAEKGKTLATWTGHVYNYSEGSKTVCMVAIHYCLCEKMWLVRIHKNRSKLDNSKRQAYAFVFSGDVCDVLCTVSVWRGDIKIRGEK